MRVHRVCESERGNVEINAEVIEGSHPIPSTTPCSCVCVRMHLWEHTFVYVSVSDGKICFFVNRFF